MTLVKYLKVAVVMFPFYLIKQKTFDQQKITEEFDNFFSNIGQNLAKYINNAPMISRLI